MLVSGDSHTWGFVDNRESFANRLESALRNHDGFAVQDDDVKALAGWNRDTAGKVEIPFLPGRVVLQDFTGVPCVVDLAAMRAAVDRLGLNRERGRRIADEVLEATANWREAMREAGVLESDVALLERCFAYRELIERWREDDQP